MSRWRTTKQASTTARGYGAAHQRLRAQWQQRINAGGVACWRCYRPLLPGTPWHLGHDDNDRRVYRGPECVGCNLTAAARKANRNRAARARQRTATPRHSRAWW